jgi:hypothetical protein
MKLAIWGSTNTGRSSLAYNLRIKYNLEKISYKGTFGFEQPKTDSYVLKILCDTRLTDDEIENYFLKRIDKDCKHLFIYRQNLLSQYLSFRHNEDVDAGKDKEIINTIDINECRHSIESMKENTKRIYNKVIENVDFVVTASYEEIFFSEKAFSIFDKFDYGIKKEDIHDLVTKLKWEQQGKSKHEQARFTMDKGIKHFSFKKNYDIIEDMFCEEFMYIDNDTKEVKFLRHET